MLNEPMQCTDQPLWTDPCVLQIIRVPSNFEARPGLQLTEDLVVGKELGEGVQGRVFCLDRPDGEGTTQLLKAGHSLSPSVLLSEACLPSSRGSIIVCNRIGDQHGLTNAAPACSGSCVQIGTSPQCRVACLMIISS